MYFSRLTLNPRHRMARADAANPYKMHQTLSRILEPEKHYLWRLEDTVLLVQTQSRPDWGQLEPNYLARPSESKPLAFELSAERTYRFRLRGNPTVTQEGKRRGLYTPESQMLWLERQAASGGFGLLGAMVSNADCWKFRKDPNTVPITLAVAEFDGYLKITNFETFQATLEKGIGHSKALGLGLLSVG